MESKIAKVDSCFALVDRELILALNNFIATVNQSVISRSYTSPL